MYVLLRRAGLRAQNAWMLLASYVFYGWWDWRFLGLLFGTTLNDYLVGLGLERTENPRHRHALILLSIGVNLGVLGFFKYYNFFVSSFIEAFAGIGVHLEAPTLKVILPVGISFYTFQAMTYTISVYRRRDARRARSDRFLRVRAFFPQLVAGPIERARHLLPQFFVPRVIEPEAFASGLRQMLWGFFCKLVVADNCATVVNSIFAITRRRCRAASCCWAPCLFAFQIYADFSGYSHIALGTARLFGFELMQNFATPYFSQNHPEFWRRWHISLSTWFRDYVYIPLGRQPRFEAAPGVQPAGDIHLSGLWHGANWTFIVWGVLNGLYVIPRVFIGEPLARPASSPNPFIRVPTVWLRVSADICADGAGVDLLSGTDYLRRVARGSRNRIAFIVESARWRASLPGFVDDNRTYAGARDWLPAGDGVVAA